MRADGEPCRAWAVRAASDEHADRAALCVAHGGRELATPGPVVVAPREGSVYDDIFGDAEYAALEASVIDASLKSEIKLGRAVLRQLLMDARKEQGLTGAALDGRAIVLFRGLEVLARLFRDQQVLESREDGLHPAIGLALDALSEELGMAL